MNVYNIFLEINYNPYNGDKLGWGNIRDNILKCSQEEAFQLYFILLKSNPLLVIKDRFKTIIHIFTS